MLNGAIAMWFILTFAAAVFVAVDIPKTPESPVLKWGFILLTAFTGPVGAFLYVLGCREPLPGSHEKYTAVPWRQVLGSTIHCVAGDGVGILAGAVIASALTMPPLAHIGLEYLLGFLFGWGIFQALFMHDMAGGSYRRSLAMTFLPELLSMNCLMAAMVPISTVAKVNVSGADSPLSPAFWFIMSMALLGGLAAAYPMNAWLVDRKLKHGMMTVRPAGEAQIDQPRAKVPHSTGHGAPHPIGPPSHTGKMPAASSSARAKATAISFAVLGCGIVVAVLLGGI
jgi:hypothetical protein